MEERKLDLKINFDKLEELSGKLKNYYDALSTMKTSVDSIQKKIEADNKGKSITALVERYEAVSNNISASKSEMKDVYKLIDGYKEDLKMYIKPLDSSKTMRVDRCDIYWNLQSLKGATDALNTSYTYHKTEFISGLTENSTEATNNYAKMEEIWNTLIPNFQDKINVLKEDMDTIYKNKIVKFDEVDLEYQKKAANLFAKYSSIPEVVLDVVADDFEVQKDIFVGTAEAIGGFIKGVGTLALLPEIQFVEDVQKTINGINALTKGDYEEWAKGEEAKEKAKQDAVLDGIKEFFEDPEETLESGLEKKFQDLSDEADVEGISYVASREGSKIAIDIGVAVATDGLLSGEGITGKAVVGGEAAAAETAGIEIGVATEEAVGKTVASGLDDVIEGSSKTISELDRIKIDNWEYTPSDELYLKYKDVFDNSKYYNQETGAVNWPLDDGFAGASLDETLQPGTVIDRYGSDYGSFTSPVGVPYEMRALAPGTELKPYSVFEVIEPVNVQSGKITPWFDEIGGGVQYHLSESVDDLLEAGVLRRIE